MSPDALKRILNRQRLLPPKTISALQFLSTRILIVYVLVFSLYKIMVNEETLILKTLNETFPNMTALALNNEGHKELSPHKVSQYIEYFRIIKRYMPDSLMAHLSLGYCYALQGNQSKAIAFFKRATEINPRAFWPYYNLGVLFFQQGQYAQAIKALDKGLTKTPAEALAAILTSKICQDIFNSIPDAHPRIDERLNLGYQEAYFLRTLCYYKTKEFNLMAQAAEIITQAPFQYKEYGFLYAGVAYYELKDCNKTAFLLTQYINFQPNDALPYLYLSQCAAMGKQNFWAKLFQEKAAQFPQKNWLSLPPFELRPKIY